MYNSLKISSSLRWWFLAHFSVDYFFAIPLFLFPKETLALVGWGVVDPLAVRLVAAALFGIGGTSFVVRNSSPLVYKKILALKIIWSSFAIAGIVFTALVDGISLVGWTICLIFAFFLFIWIYYYLAVSEQSKQ